MADETWAMLQTRSYLQTITFRLPRTFRKAVAASLGRVGETSTLTEAEIFIREAVKANVESLIEEHLGRPSSMKIKIRKQKS